MAQTGYGYMICPSCRYHYKEGVVTCPECDVALVGSLPVTGAAQVPDDSWVSVCRLRNKIQSEIARGALDSSNIPSMVLSSGFEASGRTTGAHLEKQAVTGTENLLMVPREFRDEADLVLRAVLGSKFRDNRI